MYEEEFDDWVETSLKLLEEKKDLFAKVDQHLRLISDQLKEQFKECGKIEKVTFPNSFYEARIIFDGEIKIKPSTLEEIPFKFEIYTHEGKGTIIVPFFDEEGS